MSVEPSAGVTARPRVLIVEAGGSYDVFDVIDVTDGVVRVRAPFLFEIGEELDVRVERDDAVVDARARVRAHFDRDGGRITELELSEQSEPRRVVSG